MPKDPVVSPVRAITADEWGDVVNHLGSAMVTVTEIQTELRAFFAETQKAVVAVEKRVEVVEKKATAFEENQRAIVALLENQRELLARMSSRMEKPMLFRGGDEFYATFGSRIGEEVRASIRAEFGGVANQVYAAVDAHMKANPVKMPTGSAWVPFLAFVGAAASVGHVYMSYQAARNHVPADVNVKVNGVAVPHTTAQPASNGFRHPMTRAA